MKRYTENGIGIFVHEDVKVGKNVEFGHHSCIGYGDPSDGEIIIGDNVKIGAFCLIHFGSEINSSTVIGDYCSIGPEAEIGKNSKILPGKHVSYKATIGSNCIIGGHVADRTIIEDDVTFMGEIVHSHRDASKDWDTTVEESPVIKKGSVVGVNALIIGGITIGPCAYVGAGEIVSTDVERGIAFFKGKRSLLSSFRGFIKSRCNG
jgi:UDP-3-O-[3-hydroxymyristoyl] glucosamine N-acyltransferase